MLLSSWTIEQTQWAILVFPVIVSVVGFIAFRTRHMEHWQARLRNIENEYIAIVNHLHYIRSKVQDLEKQELISIPIHIHDCASLEARLASLESQPLLRT